MRRVLHLMDALQDADVDWLTETGESLVLPPGTILITEGKPIHCLYVLLDGVLSVDVGGAQVAILHAGEVVGEISFVDSRPPTASVLAVNQCHVLAVPRDRLRKKLDEDPLFAARFYKAIAAFLADRMRVTTGRLGYGARSRDEFAADQLNDQMMDGIALAASRFDKLLRRLRTN